MNILNQLKQQLIHLLQTLYPDLHDVTGINLDFTKEIQHGDVATNCAMVVAKRLNQAPRTIAESLVPQLLQQSYVEKCEIAGPGFINIFYKASFWPLQLPKIIAEGENYGASDLGKMRKINIEFVSANPTGPMHIGHSRSAIYGDALAKLLTRMGFDVTREYYINDAGGQINVLASSLYKRYLQALGMEAEIAEGEYPGEYLIPIAQQLVVEYKNSLQDMSSHERIEFLKKYAVDAMIALIKNDLAALGVEHDIFISERFDIIERNKNQQAFAFLDSQNLLYKGILEAPKGKVPDDWEPREQDLFRATQFGDDIDRPLKKSDGSFTYFANDIAYHLDKIERNFDELILLLGADHGGYIKRITAVVKALSGDKVPLKVIINQLVNLLKDGQPYKMSKRAGNFVTVQDMLNEIGKDILRFIMLSRKNDTVLDLDFTKAKEQTKENPVFYVQYAHTRAASVLRKAEEMKIDFQQFDPQLLINPAEVTLIKLLLLFPKMLENAAVAHEPHRVISFLQELASSFHTLWSLGIEDENMRFMVDNQPQLTIARLALVQTFKQVMGLGLRLMGIEALEKM